MFRFQHEQTGALQDKLTGRLIGLARATEGNEHMLSAATANTMVEGLLATHVNENRDDAALAALMERVTIEKQKLVPNCALCACPCGRTDDYDMNRLWNADAKIRNLKSQILSGIRDIAANVHRSAAVGDRDGTVHNLLYKALIVLGMDDWDAEDLQPVVLEVEEMKQKCMLRPDMAKTELSREISE